LYLFSGSQVSHFYLSKKIVVILFYRQIFYPLAIIQLNAQIIYAAVNCLKFLCSILILLKLKNNKSQAFIVENIAEKEGTNC